MAQAPLGLGLLDISPVYKHAAPLGLPVGQDARPTGVVSFDIHIAPLERKTVFCRDMNLDLQG